MHLQEVALAQRKKAQTRKNRNAQAKKKAPKRPTQKEDLKAKLPPFTSAYGCRS